MKILFSFLCLIILSSCASESPGTAGSQNTPTAAAQNVGANQGTAAASETVAASNTITPNITNLIGVSSVKITRTADGAETIEATGDGATGITLNNPNMGVNMGNENAQADAGSGGGAAGGAGSAGRSSTTVGGSGAVGTGGAGTPAGSTTPDL